MKELTELSVAKFTNSDSRESKVLVAKTQQLQTVGIDEACLLPAACIVNFHGNALTAECQKKLWSNFPSAWWVDLSNNCFKNVKSMCRLSS